MASDSLFTLADLAEQVSLNIGSVDDYTLAKAKKWVNRALIRFSENKMWSFQYRYGQTLSTVALQEEYSISGSLKVNSIYSTGPTQRRLTLIEDRTFRAMYPNNTANGNPYFWRRTGSSLTVANTIKIGLYPIPDTIYTLKYDAVYPIIMLTSDTDDVRVVNGMPSTLVDLLIEMATAIGWTEIDDSEAQNKLKECLVRLEAAYGQDESEIDDRMVMSPMEIEDSNRFYDPVLPANYNGF